MRARDPIMAMYLTSFVDNIQLHHPIDPLQVGSIQPGEETWHGQPVPFHLHEGDLVSRAMQMGLLLEQLVATDDKPFHEVFYSLIACELSKLNPDVFIESAGKLLGNKKVQVASKQAILDFIKGDENVLNILQNVASLEVDVKAVLFSKLSRMGVLRLAFQELDRETIGRYISDTTLSQDFLNEAFEYLLPLYQKDKENFLDIFKSFAKRASDKYLKDEIYAKKVDEETWKLILKERQH